MLVCVCVYVCVCVCMCVCALFTILRCYYRQVYYLFELFAYLFTPDWCLYLEIYAVTLCLTIAFTLRSTL